MMSYTNRPPQRRMPASVYRRRRMTVLGLAIVVLALFAVGTVLLVQALGHMRDRAPQAKQPEPVPQQTGPVQAPGPQGDEATGKCPAESVEISAATDKANYKQNSTIKLELGVTNRHNASCAIDVGPAVQTYTVKQGDKVVWSSAFCIDGAQEEATQVFVSGARKNAVLPWDMIPTDDKCNRTADTLEPGQYQLVTKLGDRESQPTQFVVDAPPTPQATATQDQGDQDQQNQGDQG